jgi:predicted deacetylase
MSEYILRFDDISPYMNWDIWDEIETLLDTLDIKPLVAVVPDCKDPNIMPFLGNNFFWSRVSEWQSKGWSIAMHGYNHTLLENEGKNIVNLSKITEFSGLPYNSQVFKIKQGLKIFHINKIDTHIWIAPAHSFDQTTLKALKDCDFSIISDGLFTSPYNDKDGMFWIPQQLWKLRAMPFGIWTVCYHHNNWSLSDFGKFKKDVIKYKSKITTVDKIQIKYKAKTANIAKKSQGVLFHFMLTIKKLVRHRKQTN